RHDRRGVPRPADQGRALARGQPLPRRGRRRAAAPPAAGRRRPGGAPSARITASGSTSHVPAVGAALGPGKSGEDYWKPVFAGYDCSRQWLQENRPDVVFLVYNDHATAFSLDLSPTFAIGTGAQYAPADEGWGPRPVPVVEGHPE